MSFFPKRVPPAVGPGALRGVAAAILYYEEVMDQPALDLMAMKLITHWERLGPQTAALRIIEEGYDDIQLIYLSTKLSPAMNRAIKVEMIKHHENIASSD